MNNGPRNVVRASLGFVTLRGRKLRIRSPPVRNNRRYPEKSCRSFSLQQNHPPSPRAAAWVVGSPLPRDSLAVGGARAHDGAPNKCRRLCFNCGVCSPAFYKCSNPLDSLFLFTPLSLSLSFSLSLFPPPSRSWGNAAAKNHLIARGIEISISEIQLSLISRSLITLIRAGVSSSRDGTSQVPGSLPSLLR